MRTQRVKCPRCSRVWVAYEGEAEMECNCTEYCEDGNKPSDCAITAVTFTGDLAWPLGMHAGNPSGRPPLSDNPMLRRAYCSVHNKYIVTHPIVFPVEWTRFYSRRAPKRLRFNRAV